MEILSKLDIWVGRWEGLTNDPQVLAGKMIEEKALASKEQLWRVGFAMNLYTIISKLRMPPPEGA